MKKIKIFGASGCGNVGDDLIALILQKYLQKYFPNDEVSLIPQQKQTEEIYDADVLIIGGGGLIYDYDYNNVRNYTDAIHLAASIRLPVYMMGMGVQHVFSQEAIDAYKNAFRLVRRIATRSDKDTEFIANKLQYDLQRLVTSRDIVFLYDDVLGRNRDAISKPSNGKPTIALALADWQLGDSNYKKIESQLASDYKDYRTYLTTTLKDLKQDFTFKVVRQAKEDAQLSNELAHICGGELVTFGGVDDSARLVDVFKESDFVITNRYHGLVGAIIAQRPAIGVAFAGHKQQKLIDESFPSLKTQFYEVGQFASKGVLGRMKDPAFRNGLKTARPNEYDECLSIARKHQDVVRYIAGEFAKTI